MMTDWSQGIPGQKVPQVLQLLLLHQQLVVLQLQLLVLQLQLVALLLQLKILYPGLGLSLFLCQPQVLLRHPGLLLHQG